MRKEYRLFSLYMLMTFLAINGALYKLIDTNCEGEKTGNLIAHIVIAIVVAFGLGFLFQKIGVKFNFSENTNKKAE